MIYILYISKQKYHIYLIDDKMGKVKTREISLKESKGTFSFFKTKSNYNFSGLSSLRQVLSNEKAKILDTIKHKEPSSIYDLSKKLGRSFKSVIEDVKLLERFGFVELVKEKTKKRVRHKPILTADSVIISIKL